MDENNRGTGWVSRSVRKVVDGRCRESVEKVVQEKAVTIQVNGEELATVVCSPWHLKFMVVGFLCSEGILRQLDDLKKITVDEEMGVAYVEIPGYESSLAGKMFLKRYISPCCGRSRAPFYFSSDALLCKTVESELKVPSAMISRLAGELEERSRLYQQTHGVHNAALAENGEIIIFHEDIGRHNTLDKILGQCFLEGIPLVDKIIVFSGRVSSEILLKTAKMNIPLLISRSVPTDLTLDLARDLGITVIGFARGKSFKVYTHPERIIEASQYCPVTTDI